MKKQFKPSRGFVPNLGNFTIGDSSLEVSVDNPAFFSPSEVISKDGFVMDSNQNLDRLIENENSHIEALMNGQRLAHIRRRPLMLITGT